MRKHITFLGLSLLAGLACSLYPIASAVTPEQGESRTVREILVPFADLDVVLEHQARRVFVSREQYEELMAKAKTAPVRNAPRPTALVSSNYEATIEAERAQLVGTLQLDVLADGLLAVPLALSDASLRSATLDGQPAALGRESDGRPVLFVEGRGRHTLLLDMVTLLTTSAAQQSLQFEVPTAPAAQMRLSVPGNVEIKSGADVVSRQVDQVAGVTRFELLVPRGPVTLNMSLNNRLLRKGRVVLARSVVVDELTEAYERLHVTASMDILHGATDQFRFVVPTGFEITGVKTPQLSRWEVIDDDDRRVLAIVLREPTTQTVVLNIAAVKTPSEPADWKMPALAPLDTAGQVAVVGVLLEERYRLQSILPDGLIPIDTNVLRDTLPESVFQAEPGAPRVRPVAAYYAPHGEYALSGGFNKPAARVRVTSNLLLVLSDTEQQVRGAFSLLAEAEKIFECDFAVPAGWEVTQVTYEDGRPLSYEAYTDEDNNGRIHVMLPSGVAPGQAYSIFFQATRTPPGWLESWQTQQVEFPVFRVLDTSRDIGALAVEARDDMVVRPEKLTGLTPLDANKKHEYGLAGVTTNLAFRYDREPPSAVLRVERTRPRLTARTFSFLKFDRDQLIAHYEIVFEVDEARTRELALSLPESTPGEITLRGLDGVVLKEYGSTTADGRRLWTAQLAEPRRGRSRLAVDFQTPLDETEGKPVALPLVRAAGVAYQSGIVAVEGSAELDVQLTKHPRKVDVGELVDADYQPGRRLLGAFGFVGEAATVEAVATRHPSYELPSAIVQRAELVTLVSADGVSQTAARFLLRTKASFLEVELPEGSQLWSIYLDSLPTKPQREKDRLLLSLPTGDTAVRDLQVVYESPISAMRLWGRVQAAAPRLLLRDGSGTTGRPLPLADLAWQLHLPAGYHAVRSDGTVFTDTIHAPTLPITQVAQALLVSPGPAIGAAKRATYDGFDNAPGAASGSRSSHAEQGDDVGYLPGLSDEAEKAELAPSTREAEPATPPMHEPGEEAAPDASKPANAVPDQPSLPKADRPKGPSESPPTSTKTPATPLRGSPTGKAKEAWALEGIRSLKIDIQTGDTTGQSIDFASLGVEPVLDVTLVHQPRIDRLGWGVALAVLLIGAVLMRRGRALAKFVLVVVLVTTFVPVITGWGAELGDTLNRACYAALLLIPIYLAYRLACWILKLLGRLRIFGAAARPSITATASAGVALLLACMTATTHAEPPIANPALPIVVQVVAPLPPVKVPDDAVIIPYDPEKKLAVQEIDRLLVPYDRYVDLWNRAFPDKQLQEHPAPAAYGLAGAQFRATLDGEDYLSVVGHIDVDIFADEVVTVPLQMEGGVLAQAEIAGKPARLQVVKLEPVKVAAAAPNIPGVSNVPGPQPAAMQNLQQSQQGAPQPGVGLVPGPTGSLVTLYVSGKGRQRLNLTLRFPLERRGGWRVAAGRLPTAPATALTLIVPKASTEVQLAGVLDRSRYETRQDAEQIETALDALGSFRAQWRPKISEATVDRSLTVNSAALLDVQEDGLRLAWRLDLEFLRGQRDSFTIDVPADYLVEKVEGGNVRGWERKDADDQRRLEVTLLKTARDREQFVVHLSRRGAVGDEGLAEFAMPLVSVTSAVLHRGQFAIRRSPLIELRTEETAGVSRTDQMDSTAGLAELAVSESPLGIRGYQAYRFASVPYVVKLAAAAADSKTTAQLQTVLRVADQNRRLESRINLRIAGRPVYRMRVAIPKDLELDEVSAAQWSVADEDDRRVLDVYLTSGEERSMALLIRGQLGESGSVESIDLPRLEVLDVDRQEGDIVVQADPAFDVRAVDLTDCETVLLDRVYSWLRAGQRAVSRLAIHHATPAYKGTLQLRARSPRVTCMTITNVLVTDKALEETIYLAYTIRDAGIRSVVFRLPTSMRDARISAPLLRQKTVEPVGDDDGEVRVRLDLQDEVIGDFRVLVENDRLPTAEKYHAPLPVVESARIGQQFVVLESAGRDEVIVDEHVGLVALSRQQRDWNMLAGLLPGGITQAYLAESGAQPPRLVLHSQDRALVETAGARIELAKTLLVVDAHGAYRGIQEYFVDNSTEQFLDIQLPDGAELWTAQVAGVGVKPTQVPGAGERQVRIPLVKTAAGDANFLVAIKYGGRMDSPGWINKVSFPLLHTQNIGVELSQVRLHLPERYKWFDFGGSMRLVDESDLTADVVAYCTNQLKKFAEVHRGDNPFAKVRAKNNLQQMQKELEDLKTTGRQYAQNARLQQELGANEQAWEEAQQQIDAEKPEDEVTDGNRGRLNDLFEQQSTGLSKNVVSDFAPNFDASSGDYIASPQETNAERFSKKWIARNKLENKYRNQESENGRVLIDEAPLPQGPGDQQGKGGGGQKSGQQQGQYRSQSQAQPAAPQIAQQELPSSGRDGATERDERQDSREQTKDQLRRYEKRLNARGSQGGVSRKSREGDKGASQNESARPTGEGSAIHGGHPDSKPGTEVTASEIRLGTGVDSDRGSAGILDNSGSMQGSGLTSLDVELPERGVEYLLTTPRGELEITARAMATPSVVRLSQLGWMLALALVVGLVYRTVQRRGLNALVGRVSATLLIVGGLFLLVVGIVPLLGLAAVVFGIVQHVRLTLAKRTRKVTIMSQPA